MYKRLLIMSMLINNISFIQKLPNILSIARILLTPLVVVFLMLNLFTLAFSLYVVICISDNLDGYIARKYDCVTSMGALLDTIADKILIIVIIFGLIAMQLLSEWLLLGAVLMILREVILTAFRQFLTDHHISVSTSFFGKIKATVQMIALGLLMLVKAVPQIELFAHGIFWLAVILTLLSGYDYIYKGFKQL